MTIPLNYTPTNMSIWWTCIRWQIFHSLPAFHPTTGNPPPVWLVPSEGYVRLVRASGILKKVLENIQTLYFCRCDTTIRISLKVQVGKAQKVCFFCAECALGFPCWFESRFCVGHPGRWFSISVSFQTRIHPSSLSFLFMESMKHCSLLYAD